MADHLSFGMAASNIMIMAQTLQRLVWAEKEGVGLPLSNDEVKAVLYAFRALNEGAKQ